MLRVSACVESATTVEVEDTPSVRGMVNKVNYLVRVEEVRMKLNTLSPAEGSRKAGKRVGRGIGSGLGKTGGRGHKVRSPVPQRR